jgi:branched-chain amino acid transport system substrate-binding protein
VLLSAIDQRSAARLTNQLARALPTALLVASSGLAGSGYADPREGGVSAAAAPRVLITSPTLPARAYPPSGQAFLAAYARRFGPAQPPAIFGYESMSLMLSAIAKATDRGRKPAVRSKVVRAVFATRERQSVLGTYSIDPDGDTTLRSYGIYRVSDRGLTLVRQSG